MDAVSLGIIGGADGPTAILVSGSPDLGWWIAGVVIVAGIAIGLVWRKKHRK